MLDHFSENERCEKDAKITGKTIMKMKLIKALFQEFQSFPDTKTMSVTVLLLHTY